MRKIYLLLAFFLIISLASAEQFTLLKSQSLSYKNLEITLVNIGISGKTAVIQVNSIKTPISENEIKNLGDITINMIEVTEESVKLEVIQNVECLINEDCTGNEPCQEGSCTELKECIFKKTEGCIINNECRPIGSTENIDNKLVYCNANLEWKQRKQPRASCNNNYECLSDLCQNNKCSKPQNNGSEKMAPIWLVIIFGAIFIIKGIYLFTKPRAIKFLLRDLSLMKETSLKIIGLITGVIGILLVIWALS